VHDKKFTREGRTGEEALRSQMEASKRAAQVGADRIINVANGVEPAGYASNKAIFGVHFEASVNERAIRPDLRFLKPRAACCCSWDLGTTSPFPGVRWSKSAARSLSRGVRSRRRSHQPAPGRHDGLDDV
jgi:hypothetical protein